MEHSYPPPPPPPGWLTTLIPGGEKEWRAMEVIFFENKPQN